MRQYLVHAYGVNPGQAIPFPFNGVIRLEDHEVFDSAALVTSQQLLSEQNGGIEVKIVAFQALETAAVAPAQVPTDLQLNECGTTLPPVDSLLLIEIAPGVLLRALRPEYAEHKGDQLLFNLANGGRYIGRPRWTHP